MLVPLLAVLSSLVQQSSPPTRIIELYRGAQIGVGIPDYDVEDTTLDSVAPDDSHGGEYTLEGGPGRTILIRFGDLNRLVGPHQKIVDAKLLLTPSGDGKPALRTIGPVTKDWGEGPALTLGLANKTANPDSKVDPAQIWGSATWHSRHVGTNAKWQIEGAQAGADATPIPSAKLLPVDTGVAITGLAAAVQTMLTHPGSNFGFALAFESPTEFFSSEAASGGPRLLLTLTDGPDAPQGGDLSVISIEKTASGFRGHVQNVGNAPINGFRSSWSVEGEEGAESESSSSVAPGAEVEIDYSGSIKGSDRDHRTGAIKLHVKATSDDANPANDSLTVYPRGIGIQLVAPPGVAASFANVDSPRGKGLSNWIQSQFELVNEVYLARSKFSFSPEGCLERVRYDGLSRPNSETGTKVTLSPEDANDPLAGEKFIWRILQAIGAPPLGKLDFKPGTPLVKVDGFKAGGTSWFPGASGGGDTRYEGGLPPTLSLPEAAYYSPIFDSVNVLPCGPLESTTVNFLNNLLNKSGDDRVAAVAALAHRLPGTTLLRAMDSNGVVLKGAVLDFYQSRGGTIDNKPAFTSTVSDLGVLVLDTKPISGSKSSPNIFGSDNLFEDGAFLVKTTANGEVAYAWLKVWQLLDIYARGGKETAFVNLYFDVPAAPVDRTTDYAIGRAVTDSIGSLPAKLTTIVGGPGEAVDLPQHEGDFIEIDLNRDRTLDELRLTTTGNLWQKFDIQIYGTGQKPEEAITWGREVDWKWTSENRNQGDGTKKIVAYHGAPLLARYIRLVCRKSSTAKLLRIEAFSPKVEQ